METRQKLCNSPEQFIDVYFEELLDAPVACVEKIYRHFNMQWSDALRIKLYAFMLQNGRDKHGKHQYNAAMFGLDEQVLDEVFSEYRQFFGIQKNRGT